MPKVIGYCKELKLQTICTNCTAIIEYLPLEVRNRTYTDLGGGSEIVYYIVCPNCTERLDVDKPKI